MRFRSPWTSFSPRLDFILCFALALATLGKAHLPEPLRVAHLIGQAMVLGQSRGRV